MSIPSHSGLFKLYGYVLEALNSKDRQTYIGEISLSFVVLTGSVPLWVFSGLQLLSWQMLIWQLGQECWPLWVLQKGHTLSGHSARESPQFCKGVEGALHKLSPELAIRRKGSSLYKVMKYVCQLSNIIYIT